SGVYETSTNAGTAWSIYPSQLAYWRVAYSDDGSYDGFPLTGVTAPDTTNTIYGAREVGSMFTSPLASMKIAGIGMQVSATTSSNVPTGAARFCMWTGTSGTLTSLGCTTSTPPANLATPTYTIGWFSNPPTIAANTNTRVTLSETTNSDAS